MAKISELVKTYKLLSDPQAPDWNVKFVGGMVIALAIIAASGALVYSNLAQPQEDAASLPAAAMQEEPAAGDPPACDPTEVAEALAANGGAALPAGTKLASGCVMA